MQVFYNIISEIWVLANNVHADSQEKTAFITHQWLFEFKVGPFGVTNAPAAFQRLMQQVFAELQNETSIKFVSV